MRQLLLSVALSAFIAAPAIAQPVIILTGYEKAIRMHLIKPNSPYSQALRAAIALMQRGITVEAAAAQTGINLAALQKLIDLGTPIPTVEATLPVFQSQPPMLERSLKQKLVVALAPKLSNPTFELGDIKPLFLSESPKLPAQVLSQKRSQVLLASILSITEGNALTSPLPTSTRLITQPTEGNTPKILQPHPVQAVNRFTQANALVKGLIVANRQKRLTYREKASVQDAIYFLRKGQPLAKAAAKAGVSLTTLNHLLALTNKK